MIYDNFVDLGSWFIITFIIGQFLSSLITSMLDWLNSNKTDIKEKTKKILSFSPIAKKLFTTNKINKAMKYKTTVENFENFNTTITSSFSALLVIFGLIPFVLNYTLTTFPNIPLIYHYVTLSVLGILFSNILTLPFSYYYNFHIETEYGFNNMTKNLFFKDAIKSNIISVCFVSITLFFLNYIFSAFGKFNSFHICLFIAGACFLGSVISFLYMNYIMYWFNKFEPLKKGTLKTKITKLLKNYGYNIDNVYVMNESIRSNKSNAFITGAFNSKRIVLFDTLLKNMSEDEIIAILGHELAHGKLHHLLIGKVINIATLTLISFITFKFLIYNVDFYHAFGYTWVTNENILQNCIIGFNLSMMFIGSVKWVLNPFNAKISRMMEYAADRYSIRYTKKRKAMIESLLKLSSENLSDLYPNEYYEMWNYSHPSILNRIKAILKTKSK